MKKTLKFHFYDDFGNKEWDLAESNDDGNYAEQVIAMLLDELCGTVEAGRELQALMTSIYDSPYLSVCETEEELLQEKLEQQMKYTSQFSERLNFAYHDKMFFIYNWFYDEQKVTISFSDLWDVVELYIQRKATYDFLNPAIQPPSISFSYLAEGDEADLVAKAHGLFDRWGIDD
jgi:hypothetical protein